jgi:hypothetical protein
MRHAFVLTLDDSESDPALRRFNGWIEEVDTAQELRFRSTDELLAFLAKCVDERTAGPADPTLKED